jgi:hypothetical protein
MVRVSVAYWIEHRPSDFSSAGFESHHKKVLLLGDSSQKSKKFYHATKKVVFLRLKVRLKVMGPGSAVLSQDSAFIFSLTALMERKSRRILGYTQKSESGPWVDRSTQKPSESFILRKVKISFFRGGGGSLSGVTPPQTPLVDRSHRRFCGGWSYFCLPPPHSKEGASTSPVRRSRFAPSDPAEEPRRTRPSDVLTPEA